MTTLKVLGVVFIIINWCILCPFCVYYSLLYLKKAQNSCHRRVLQLRQPGTIKMNLFMICYFFLVEQTITLFETFDLIPWIPSLISLCLALPTYCLLFYSAMIRSWLLYYDREIQWTVLQNQYSSGHGSNHFNAPNCGAAWFVKHRHTLGNARFLYSLLLIIYIASIILLLICGYLAMQHTHSYIYLAIAQLLIIVTPIVFACGILMTCYLNTRLHTSQRQSKRTSQKRYARQYLHISYNTLHNLDKEIFLILVWSIIACLVRLISAVSCNLIVMHVFDDKDRDTHIAYEYEYIYSLWSYDTSQYTGIYVVYTVWALFSVFILHLIQTRRNLYILSELNWFHSNDPIQSPPSQIRDLSKHSISADDAHDVGKGMRHMDRIMPIIHVTGQNTDEDDQESVTLLPSSAKYLDTNAKSHYKKWEYAHIATKEPEEDQGMDPDEDEHSDSNTDTPVIGPHIDATTLPDATCVTEAEPVPTNHKLRWKLNIFGNKNKSKQTDAEAADHETIQKAKTEEYNHTTTENLKKGGLALLSKFHKAKSDNNRNAACSKEKQPNDKLDDDELNLNDRAFEIPLHEILTVKEGYDTFMHHLAKEYSTENLSFLTEVTQFKHRFCMELVHDVQRIYHAQVVQSKPKIDAIATTPVMDKKRSQTQSLNQYPPKERLKKLKHSNSIHTINTSQKDAVHINAINTTKQQLELEHHKRTIHVYEYGIKYGWNLRLCDTIPLTEILTDDHWRSFYSKAHKLYKKYIEPGSDSEINISYQCRNCITKYFTNYPNQSVSIHKPPSHMSHVTKQSVSSTHSERDVFASDTCSVDSYPSHHHAQDDMSRFKRKGSLSSIVDEGFRLKKSRSFHNVFEADKLYLEEEEEQKGDVGITRYDHGKIRRNDSKFKIKLHDISNTKNILDKLDEKVFLLQLFDDAAEEIYSVLKRDSLHRFYDTESYTNTFLSKYIQNGNSLRDLERLESSNEEGEEAKKDVNIIFYYYCTCKRRHMQCVSQCECKEKYLKREPFKAKLKRMKRKGIKRKKPLWSGASKGCTHQNRKEEEEEIKIKITRQKAVDVNYWSALSSPVAPLSPAVSISRRSNTKKGNHSPMAMAAHHDHANSNNVRQSSLKHSCSQHTRVMSNTEMNWKLEHTQMMDTENGYYYDDMMVDNTEAQNVWEYNHKGVPIVRIINVNVVSNNHACCAANSIDASASPSPKTQIFHRAYGGVYGNHTPNVRKTRSLKKERD